MLEALWDGTITMKDLKGHRFETESWWDRFQLHFGLAPVREQHAAFLRETREEFEQWKRGWNPVEMPAVPGIQIEMDNGDHWYKNFVAGQRTYRRVQPRTQALMRCAALALAAEQFRMEKGAWPSRLENLAPMYIKEVPQDPYSQVTIRMVRKHDRLVIYSVGVDGKDNGGDLNRLLGGADYGFQLWDPPARVLEPAE
jgi:hypothetical protein